MQRLKGVLFFVFSAFFLQGMAQGKGDTLHLQLDSAEKFFLSQNYSLLAQKYNIDAQKALVLQARLWPNPNLSIAHGPVFHVSNPDATFINNSSTAASLSQLILLAGKRNKQIKLAEANAKLSEYQFFDLLRTLKYTLRTDFFSIYYLQRSASVYEEEINSLQLVVNAFMEQLGKGYIAEKEVVRIRAQMYSLQSEYNDLLNQINDLQTELKLILQVKPSWYIDPLVDSGAVSGLDPDKYSITTLVDSAYHNRTDLQIARANTDINKLNYSYQRSLAVPDLTLAFSYDQQGSYVNNFQAIGAAIDLPFFNRNQGNIKSARTMIDYSTALEKSTAATVEGNVARALQKAFAQDKLYKSIDPKFSRDFNRLMHEVLQNYQKRNLSLLDFLDFYDSYKENILQANSIQSNRVTAFEDLNYYTGTPFFNN
ncbi:MAG: TolC family protein [Bacteroidetes bacterium]|nr:MAG: TolC family protein [Bacteroidota bacterium]